MCFLCAIFIGSRHPWCRGSQPKYVSNPEHRRLNPIVFLLLLQVASVIHYLSEAVQADGGSGAMLVFLPGWAEIAAVQKTLLRTYPPQQCRIQKTVLPLHSTIPSCDQRRIFQPVQQGPSITNYKLRMACKATSGFEMCFTIASRHLWCWGSQPKHVP